MSIPYGSELFFVKAYSVELYWFQGPPAAQGVFLFVLEVYDTGLPAEWEVFYLPFAQESWIIGE